MGHWYTVNGSPQHTQKTASKTATKKYRATTLRDARKKCLLPSVSTICDQTSKDQLEKWKLGLILEGIHWNLDGIPVDYNEFKAWALKFHSDKLDEYADKGKEGHDAIEKFLLGEEYLTELAKFPELFHKAVTERWGDYIVIAVECSFGSKRHGYGGQLDSIVFFTKQKKFGLLDPKTKKSEPGKKFYVSDKYLLQLTAYKKAYEFSPEEIKKMDPTAASFLDGNTLPEDSIIANILISQEEEDRYEIIEHSPEEQINGWHQFRLLRDFYFASKKFDPRFLEIKGE